MMPLKAMLCTGVVTVLVTCGGVTASHAQHHGAKVDALGSDTMAASSTHMNLPEAYVSTTPSTAAAFAREGSDLVKHNRFEEAAQSFVKAAETYQEEIKAIGILWSTERLQQSRALHDLSGHAFSDAALAYFKAGHYETAFDYFQRAHIQFESGTHNFSRDFTISENIRASLSASIQDYQTRGEHEKAAKIRVKAVDTLYSSYLAVSEKSTQLIAAAQEYFKGGNDEQCLALLRKVAHSGLAPKEHEATAHENIGIVLSHQGKYEEAGEAYSTAARNYFAAARDAWFFGRAENFAKSHANYLSARACYIELARNSSDPSNKGHALRKAAKESSNAKDYGRAALLNAEARAALANSWVLTRLATQFEGWIYDLRRNTGL